MRPAASTPDVRLRPETGLLLACLDTEPCLAEAALARQPALMAPVKLASAASGETELRAEILRGRGVDAEGLARAALRRAEAWLVDDRPEGAPDAFENEAIAAALGELPKAWAWEPRGEGAVQVDVHAFGTRVRVSVQATAGGAHVSLDSAEPARHPDARRALARYALEANFRLRLARIGVAPGGDEAVRITWDAVVGPGVGLERALPAAVTAVVGAHAATRRALRALTHASVAQTYLDARGSSGAREGFHPA